MANTILTPDVLAPEATMLLSNAAVTFGLFQDASHTAEFSSGVKKGDTIRVRVPGPPDVREFTGAAAARDISEGSVPVVLEKHFFDKVAITASEMTLDLEDFSIQVLNPIMIGIAERLSTYAASKISLVPYFTGTAGAPPSDRAAVLAANRVLGTNRVPPAGRRAIVDEFAEESILSIGDFVEANTRGDEGTAMRTASMGSNFNIQWWMDQSIGGPNVHVAGTLAGAPAVDGVVLEGATTMNLLGGAANGTIVPGDLFTVAGVPGSFVFVTGATASGLGAVTGPTPPVAFFSPAAPPNGFADTAAVTVVGNHTKNLIFGPGAFTAVAIPLAASAGAGSSSTFFDPRVGVGVNITFDYDGDALKDTMVVHVLAGAQLVQAELAVVMLG